MTRERTKETVLEADFLALRAKILEVAAGLDRFDHAAGECDDARRERLNEAIRILLTDDDDRARQVQLLFSRQYADTWRADLGVV